MGERPVLQPPRRRWVCTCKARPLLGVVVGGALQVRVPLALVARDRVSVRCPKCRNIRTFLTRDLAA